MSDTGGSKGDTSVSHRTELRECVWSEMGLLETAGLGQRKKISELRDKFLLDSHHPSVDLLSDRPEADGFIRADKGSLLFRDATSKFIVCVPQHLKRQAMENASKGLEFRWTQINGHDIRLLFSLVASLAFSAEQ